MTLNTTAALNLGTLAGVALSANKDLAKTAAYMEAGRIVNNKVTALVVPKLPMMVRGYAATPVGKLVIANIILIGAQKLKPDNQVLAKLGYAAVTQAYTELFESFDIEGLLNSFLNDSGISKAMGIVQAADTVTPAQA